MEEQIIYKLTHSKPSVLERFGLYYLTFFKKIDSNHSPFNLTDDELTKRLNNITLKGIILSCAIGILCVFPTVWVDVYFTNENPIVHYSLVAGVTAASVVIELYVLFLIALRAVYKVSEIINLHATESDLQQDGLFSVQHILARTALELPDPELEILGVDPFKRISKKNLFLLGLLYKAKIFITNFVVKNMLLFTAGKTILGFSILYESILVECFWNSVVITRVVHEARLRLFGFALANQIGKNILKNNTLDKLTPLARKGCLRSIGNAVVMAKNYHPNMIILFIHFQKILKITEVDKYDDWNIFLDTLQNVSAKERFFLLDLFTLAAAFDGKISNLESTNLKSAYGEDFSKYEDRVKKLTSYLKQGKLNAALKECKLDFKVG